jgi:twinkle protein
MRIQSSITKRIFDFEPVPGKRTICPECSGNRRKSKELIVHWEKEGNRGFCHHCETTFFPYESKEKPVYVVPESKNTTELTDKAVTYFEGRAISQKTLNEMRVYSSREYMPQFQKEVDVICFPYFRAGELVNIKYRGPEKSFKLYQGAELLFWNEDSIKFDDFDSIIIVEGEIDLLSFIEAGQKSVISVPAGANKNLEYLEECIKLFACPKIYLAVDQDKKGVELRDELARRLGMDKCLIVSFKECKDANEYLCKYGALELSETIKNAKPFPVNGIVKVGDIYSDIVNLYQNGIQKGLQIKSGLDQFVTWEAGRLAIITGIPGHGKSEFVDWLVCKLNILFGWRAAYFTPENYPLKFHYAKIFEKLIGKQFNKFKTTDQDFTIAYEYIRDNFFYLMDEEDYSVEMVLEGAKQLIRSKGIKVLIIDPYNKLEYQAGRGENETQYISRFLDKLQMFARFNNVMVILVAHPKKMNKNGKIFEVPSLYDISGSAHFYNKADYGLSIYRLSNEEGTGFENMVQIHVQKVKFKHLGECGKYELRYNYNNGRFENEGSTVDIWDNSNWLINQPIEQVIDFDSKINDKEIF